MINWHLKHYKLLRKGIYTFWHHIYNLDLFLEVLNESTIKRQKEVRERLGSLLEELEDFFQESTESKYKALKNATDDNYIWVLSLLDTMVQIPADATPSELWRLTQVNPRQEYITLVQLVNYNEKEEKTAYVALAFVVACLLVICIQDEKQLAKTLGTLYNLLLGGSQFIASKYAFIISGGVLPCEKGIGPIRERLLDMKERIKEASELLLVKTEDNVLHVITTDPIFEETPCKDFKNDILKYIGISSENAIHFPPQQFYPSYYSRQHQISRNYRIMTVNHQIDSMVHIDGYKFYKLWVEADSQTIEKNRDLFKWCNQQLWPGGAFITKHHVLLINGHTLSTDCRTLKKFKENLLINYAHQENQIRPFEIRILLVIVFLKNRLKKSASLQKLCHAIKAEYPEIMIWTPDDKRDLVGSLSCNVACELDTRQKRLEKNRPKRFEVYVGLPDFFRNNSFFVKPHDNAEYLQVQQKYNIGLAGAFSISAIQKEVASAFRIDKTLLESIELPSYLAMLAEDSPSRGRRCKNRYYTKATLTLDEQQNIKEIDLHLANNVALYLSIETVFYALSQKITPEETFYKSLYRELYRLLLCINFCWGSMYWKKLTPASSAKTDKRKHDCRANEEPYVKITKVIFKSLKKLGVVLPSTKTSIRTETK